ncbi:MAG: twin-arginine translocation signal domain-containing protein [Acidimicrobiales bacterium]
MNHKIARRTFLKTAASAAGAVAAFPYIVPSWVLGAQGMQVVWKKLTSTH